MLLSCSKGLGDSDNAFLDSLEKAIIDTSFNDPQDFYHLFRFQEEVIDSWTHMELNDVPERYMVRLNKARLVAEKSFPELLDETNYYFFFHSYYQSILQTPFSLGKELIDSTSQLDLHQKLEVLNTLIMAYRTYERSQEIIALLKKKNRLLSNDSTSTVSVQDFIDLGMAYYSEGNFALARQQFTRAVSHFKKTGIKFEIAEHQNNIGLAFKEEGNVDSAAHYFRLAIDKMASVKDHELPEEYPKGYQAHFTNVMAANLHLLNWKDAGYDFIQETLRRELKSSIKFREYFIEVSSRKKLCEFYLHHGKIDDALDMSESLQLLVKRYDLKHHHALAFTLLGKCKLAIGETQEALGLFDQAETIEDSLRRTKAEQQAIFAAMEYQTEKKEKELQLQRLRLSNQDIQLHADQNQLRMLLIIAGLLLAAIALTFFFYSKVKASNRVIKAQNEQTTSDLKTKELLLKEVNHRVKNNLQVVSGLLAKQAGLAPDQVKVYLEESQQRLESIALIHKRLYENEAFQYLEFKPLVEELVSQIEEVNRQSGASIEVQTEIAPIQLHIDIATPVSLILNELMNNAYKHGFKGIKEGLIRIRLVPEQRNLVLTVADNGNGIGKGVDIFKKKSLGMGLVKGLSWQIHGDFSYHTDDHTTTFQVRFNPEK